MDDIVSKNEQAIEQLCSAAENSSSSQSDICFEQLNQMTEGWRRDEEQINDCMKLVYERLHRTYWYVPDEVRQEAAIMVWLDVSNNYDPEKMDLGYYVFRQIKYRVRDCWKRMSKKAGKVCIVSYDDRRKAKQPYDGDESVLSDENENVQLDENTPAPINAHVSKDFDQPTWKTAADMILEMALNPIIIVFERQLGESRAKAARHYSMLFTEQIAYVGCQGSGMFPEECEKDILNAMDIPYFRFFTKPQQSQTFTLKSIETAIPKSAGEVIPGKPYDKPLTWDENCFLPEAVQIEFWKKEENIKVIPATITKYRNDYKAKVAACYKHMYGVYGQKIGGKSCQNN